MQQQQTQDHQTPTPNMAAAGPITTPLTDALGCQHPILLAGMAQVSGGRLAAAVANAGGFSVVGGYGCTPDRLRATIADMKSRLLLPLPAAHHRLPFGVAVAVPQVGGSARRTNRGVSSSALDELVGIAISSGARLFVCSAGAPPRRAVDRLHAAGVLVMSVVGHPRHAARALDAGADMVCAQGKEGRGQTGDVPTSVLVPAVAAVAERHPPTPLLRSMAAVSAPLVVAGGGVATGRGLAGALMLGAAGAWVCTRFVASAEADAADGAKQAVVDCGFGGTERTLVLTGRPLRMRPNGYIREWHARRGGGGGEEEIKRLCASGIVPAERDLAEGRAVDVPVFMGEVAGAITDVLPAGRIVADMVEEAAEMLKLGRVYLGERSRL